VNKTCVLLVSETCLYDSMARVLNPTSRGPSHLHSPYVRAVRRSREFKNASAVALMLSSYDLFHTDGKQQQQQQPRGEVTESGGGGSGSRGRGSGPNRSRDGGGRCRRETHSTLLPLHVKYASSFSSGLFRTQRHCTGIVSRLKRAHVSKSPPPSLP
jgi:hypothetical protein